MTRSTAVRLILALTVLFAIGTSRAVASRVYGAPCGQTTGLPALLVKMHFVSKGNGCPVDERGRCQGLNDQCKITRLSGESIDGRCVTVIDSCICVPVIQQR